LAISARLDRKGENVHWAKNVFAVTLGLRLLRSDTGARIIVVFLSVPCQDDLGNSFFHAGESMSTGFVKKAKGLCTRRSREDQGRK